MEESIRNYMAEIGRKGGKANKGKASEKCRLAAKARWEKFRAKKDDDSGDSTEADSQEDSG